MLGIGRAGPTGGGSPRDVAGTRDAGTGPGSADRERDAWVVLAGVTGVGPVSFGRLVAAFGSAWAVLVTAGKPGAVARLVDACTDPDGGPATLGPDTARAIAEAAQEVDRRLAPVRTAGVQVITLADEDYPARVRRIELPPPVLFLRGNPASLDRERAVAIVGTRRPTEAGRQLAARIAEAVGGLGVTVVSGLALGIDGAAHAATIRSGTPTVAVIGGGHSRLYPAAHRGLADAIVGGGGAVLSEFPPDTIPTRGTFPRRNRIISGLADATVVVEAGARSGALTTAAWALEQGRGLHVVPGRVGDPAVAGCLAFLRETAGEARIVAGVAELIEDLGLLSTRDGARGDGETSVGPQQISMDALLATLAPAERSVARELVGGTGSVDELAAATGYPGATLLGVLTSLEVRGMVLEAFGRYRAAGPLARTGQVGRPAALRPGGRRRRAA
jgi:DNA processing protein